MPTLLRRLYRQLPGVVAVLLALVGYVVVKPPTTSAAAIESMASHYRFTPMTIAMPAASTQQSIRRVNKDYEHIRAWVSSVGAAVAMADLRGTGRSADLCIVDTRTDQVAVTPVPGTGSPYAPFNLDPAPLPMNPYIAPMGCVAGDFNEDGRTDLLVYYWGRTPILFLARPAARRLDAAAFRPSELVPGPNSTGGTYSGAKWNTNTATVADFDGDGHQDVFIGNYFPDGSPVLDDRVSGGVVMNHSMSHAQNGGGKYIFRWTGAGHGDRPWVSYTRHDHMFPPEARHGWSLASSSIDLTGDQLPDLYIANDFGPDRLLHNESRPGRLRFADVRGRRDPVTPKSKIVGNDSFKGMGVDAGDLDHTGMYDFFVSNITTSWGLQESNFQFMDTAGNRAGLASDLARGIAPFRDRSAEAGTAWSGWGWDVKMGDFDNAGQLSIVQATGFVKGRTNRWPQLQELATANDAMLDNPFWWPNAEAGDDIAGSQALRFFVRGTNGRYTDLAGPLGLAVPVPTRGIATGDADGDGRLDFAVARQWDAPVFYHNDAPDPGAFLGLDLTYDTPVSPGPMPAPGSPVIGAEVTVTTPDGHRFIDRVDGGSGHSGKRSHYVHIGLGEGVTGPLRVHLQWRDRDGRVRHQDLRLDTGWHALVLGTHAKEK